MSVDLDALQNLSQKYPIYVLLISLSPTFHSVVLYVRPLLNYRPFCTHLPNDPKMALDTTRVKDAPCRCYFYSEYQIYVSTSLRSAFFELQTFFEKIALFGNQINLEQHMVKDTQYMCFWCPRVQNFNLSCSTTNHFRVTGRF